MLRLPAVAGRFYPSQPSELAALVRECCKIVPPVKPIHARACLVPHAGYIYSGHVAGAVLARIAGVAADSGGDAGVAYARGGRGW